VLGTPGAEGCLLAEEVQTAPITADLLQYLLSGAKDRVALLSESPA
jgi:hypothetical protein